MVDKNLRITADLALWPDGDFGEVKAQAIARIHSVLEGLGKAEVYSVKVVDGPLPGEPGTPEWEDQQEEHRRMQAEIGEWTEERQARSRRRTAEVMP